MFRVGDLVMCVDDSGVTYSVTKGSIYRVVKNKENDDDMVYVIDNTGNDFGLWKYRFVKFDDIKVKEEVW